MERVNIIMKPQEQIAYTMEERDELLDPQEEAVQEVEVVDEEEKEVIQEEVVEDGGEEIVVEMEKEEAVEEQVKEEKEEVFSPEDQSRWHNADYFRTVDLEFLQNYRQESGGSTCLHIATKDQGLECCKVIYERCPELLFISNSIGNTVFHIIYGSGQEPVTLLEFFLDVGAKMTAEDTVRFKALLAKKNMYGKTALMAGVEYDIVKSAILNDDILDLWFQAEREYKLGLYRMTDNKNDTPLHWAVLFLQVYLVKQILEAEPDFHSGVNDSGDIPLWTALFAARNWSDSQPADIRRLLLKHQPSQIAVPRGEERWSALHYCVYEDDLRGIKDIIQFSPESMELLDIEGRNFLHIAAKFGKIQVVKYILEAKEIPDRILNQSDNNGYTPLHYATMSRKNDNKNLVLHLLYNSRVDKTKTSNKGRSALEWITFDYDESRF